MSAKVFLNLGSPFRREDAFPVLRDGVWVDDTECLRGEHFVPTAEERLRCAYKLRPTDLALPEGFEVPEEVSDEAEAALEAQLAEFSVGGGWYEFPGAEEGADPVKVQGKDAAIAKLRDMTAGDGEDE